ncbi:radical SAM family heme chaperone HemW [Metabacillus sp. HB246100]
MVQSAYIHIPFCHHICHYCDFNKVFFKQQPVDEYIEMVIQEMKYATGKQPDDPMKTIFIGGGTPTALTPHQLERLLEGITSELNLTSELIEFAVEANPGELTEDKLIVLKNAGVNRLSIGVQSFNDELLKKIGRVHTKKDVFRTIEQAEKIGFDNLSLDLIYALPGQTVEDFQDTLTTSLSLDVKHYSAYSLIIEPKTVFYNLMKKGKLSLPPQELEAEMYELAMEEMEKHGFMQYEISNYAKPGYESQHNLTYWNNEDYYGFGAGAHGYVNGVRTSNIGPVKKFIDSVKEKNEAFQDLHHVTLSEKMEEEMFLGLRRTKGVSHSLFKQKYGVSIEDKFPETVKKLVHQGLLQNEDDFISLTRKGKLLGNEVFQEFLLS